MSAKYKSPSFLLPNELNTSANPANDTGVNSLYSMDFPLTSYINLGATSDFDFNTSNFSISLWMKKDGNSGSYQPLVDLGGYSQSPYNQGTSIYSNTSNQIHIYNRGSSPSNWLTSITTTTGWNHIVVVRNGDNLTVYINNTSSQVNQNFTGVSSINFGGSLLSRIAGANSWSGKIDEVAIFNRVLNTTEISALYDGTGSNIRPSNLMATDLNPIAYYPLGEQAQNSGKLPDTTTNEWQFPNGVLQDYVMDFGSSVGKFINLPNEISLSGEFAMSFWLKPTANNINLLGNSNNTNYVYINPSNQVGISSSDIAQTFSSTIISSTSSNWQNLLITRDSSNVFRTYVNGNIENTVTDAGTFSFNQIGRYYNVSTNDYRGEMSNVAIWNTDQSSNKDNIYNNGSPQTTYTVSPQNWWKLNADSVYTPSAPNYTKALSFDGTNDYIDCGNDSSFNLTTGLTVSTWVKLTAYQNDKFILAKRWGSSSYQIATAGGGKSQCSVWIGSTRYDAIGSTVLSADTWYNIVGTFDGSNVKVYVNSILEDTTPASGSLATTTDIVSIAKGLNNDSYNFNGFISNAAIFNSALTPSQVSTLFNFGTPETNISFNPVAWWKLDDQTAITDSSGNGNTGTNNGATDATTSVAVVPSWKIPTALPITTTPNYTTALDFVANGDTISIPDSNDLDLSGTDFSISFWVNANSINSSQMILQKYSGSTGWAIYNKSTSNSLEFYQAGAFFSLDTNSIDNNIWSHYVVTANVSASEYKIYKNGSLTNTISRTVNITSSTQPLYIGSLGGTGFYYNGLLSNIAIYNSTLLPSQVSTIYNNGTPETAISFSPISWWKLDTGGSTITDYGSGGNNGTNNGASPATSDVLATQPVNGVSTTLPSTALQQSDLQFDSPFSNYSLSFDGSTSFIDCGDSDIFSFGDSSNDSPFSISTWVNWRSISSNNPPFVSKWGSSLKEWIFILNNDGKIRFYLIGGGGNVQKISATTLSSNTWYHVTATYDGSGSSTAYNGMNLYINGVKENATNAGTGYSAMTNTSQPVEIGRYQADRYFDGKIDETAIFNTELTSAQVLEIYNNGKPKDLTTFSGTAPISWWRLGENAYFQDSTLVLPNSITGAPNGNAATNNLEMISADAPGTYANGIGTNLDILDRVGDAALSTSNSQSYNMIPSDISPYVPQYVGKQIANNFSMTFDGTNYFTASSKFDFIQQTAIFSISTWIKMSDNTSATNQVIAGTNYTGSNVGWQLWIDNRSSQSPAVNKTLKFHLWNSATNLLAIDQVITDNNWNLITITGDGTTIRAYKNGSLLSTTQSISGSTSSIAFSDLRIGANTVSSPSVFFNGQIDEVAIFDTALNAGQIYNDIYQPTSTATNKTADLVNNPNLPTPVAWYRMGD